MSFLFEPFENSNPKTVQPFGQLNEWNNWNPKVQQPFAEQACPPCDCKGNDPLPTRGLPKVKGSSFLNYGSTKPKPAPRVKGSSFANYQQPKKRLTAKQQKQVAMYGSKEQNGILDPLAGTGGIKSSIREPFLPPPPMQDALGALYGYDELGAAKEYFSYNSKGDYIACDKGVNKGRCRIVRKARTVSPIKVSPNSPPIITKGAVNTNVSVPTANGGSVAIYNTVPVPMTAVIPPFGGVPKISHGWKTTFENLASQVIAGTSRNPTTQIVGGQVAPVNLPYVPTYGGDLTQGGYSNDPNYLNQNGQVSDTGAAIGAGVGSGVDGIFGFMSKNPVLVLGGVGALALLFMKPPGGKRS